MIMFGEKIKGWLIDWSDCFVDWFLLFLRFSDLSLLSSFLNMFLLSLLYSFLITFYLSFLHSLILFISSFFIP